ncbi:MULTISPECIES: sodium/proline symporter PutP [unclassified Shewanella]|uniref:sodium/proline symporter PutP n=1 Tax=unclassified Shewanella TaxID=196818 RepID=UPI000C826FB1|nr:MULTISPECIES: sodium/proline symporter PutP [unclassified Shewanella]MDO6638514.1 sodium/proline symporter PutP [Shewanella sp. 5_MG-2023]MDO6677317.1 sodium/proline symporter PutP [Shewanella sp. 4_MG-2023]MDO6774336.1 sodium/proline symporter PutP [Shewanella sp. 3_MG-2023]PMG29321.1 sodium/proline symporter [Shewanella sp. 10N.286.52.C2]PMG42271.1 sodium/proline symporter [Shewanella sp. 10N.286.52.B9]
MEYTYISLGVYFVLMLAIGIYAAKTSTANLSEYMLGGRQVSPQVTALSAGASDMSGWMLMGLPGAIFVSGFDTIWVALGLVIGAWANYKLVAPKLRLYTEKTNDSLTLPDFFGKRFDKENGVIRLISAVVIIIFFTLYTSAGLVGGGKLFETAFAMNYQTGVVITMLVVVAYTLMGGFLAVSMTDFVQGVIMFIALILVPVVAFTHFDSPSSMMNYSLETIPSFSESLSGLTLVSLLSSLAWGLGYFGQPHIIVRFMAIDSVKNIKTARRIGMSWMTVTIIGALATGLTGVAYTRKFEVTLADPETIFIFFSEVLFHPLIGGFLLAAILAAVMSTISSQLLVSSSSLTEDIYRAYSKKAVSDKTAVNIGRLCVFGVAVVASFIAMNPSSSILSIVSNAWAGFGAAFGPLILFSLLWQKVTYEGALAGIITGTVTVLFWIFAPVLANGETLSSVVYEMLPGFFISAVSIWLVSLITKAPSAEIQKTFKDVNHQLIQQLS